MGGIRTVFLITMGIFLVAVGLFGQISVTGSLTHSISSTPGSNYSRVITIRNDGFTPQTVRVYQTDYSFQYDGRVFYNVPGTIPRSNSGWISLPVTNLTIQPGEEIPLSYGIRIPQSENLTGTYWSVIMVEGVLAGDTQTGGLQHLMRFAVQVINEFPGGLGSLSPIAARLEPKDFLTNLVLVLENDGTRMLRPEVSAELYRRDGTVFGPFTSEARRMYPGTTATFQIPLTDVPLGEYRSVVLIDAGENDIFAIQYTLEIKE